LSYTGQSSCGYGYAAGPPKMTKPQISGTIGNDSGRPLGEEGALSAEQERPEVSAPETACRDIEGLVQRFARNRDLYTRPECRETQVRTERMLDLHKKLAAATIPADKEL